MATIDQVRTANEQILRTDISDAQATTIAQQIDADPNDANTIASYQQTLLLQARTSSIPALIIDQVFTGSINSAADINYFRDSYVAALNRPANVQVSLAAAQDLAARGVITPAEVPARAFALQQLNAFQALGADLAGDASTNANFLTRFGAFVQNTGENVSAQEDLQFIQAAYNAVFPGVTPAASVVSQYTAALAALRVQYGDNATTAGIENNADLKAKGALLGQIAGEAVVNNQTNALFLSAQNTLLGLATGGTFQAGQLGQNVVGGQGVIGVEFTLTEALGENFDGTTANDTVNAIIGGANATLNNFDEVEGAAGTDTFNAVVRGNGAIPTTAVISGFETINLDQTTALLNNGNNIDADTFVGAQAIWQINDTQNIVDLNAGQTAGFRNDLVNASALYDNGVAAASVALDGVTSGSFVSVDGNGLTSVTVSGSVDADTADADGDANTTEDGFLQINVSSQDVLNGTDTDIDTQVTALNLALTSDVQLSVFGTDAVNLETIDASTSTGDITTNIAFGADALALETIRGGSGDDNLTLDVSGFSAATVGISGNAGNDVVTVTDTGTSTSAVALTLTLGGGNDTVDVDSLANILTVSSGGVTAGLVTVADFNVDEDVLDLNGLGLTRDVLTNTELGIISGSSSLLTALQAADAATTDGNYATFDFGNDLYVYVDNGANGLDAGDGLLRVVGASVTDLDAQNFVA